MPIIPEICAKNPVASTLPRLLHGTPLELKPCFYPVMRIQEFFEDDTMHILVSKLLNCQNEHVSDKDTKLDVLAILANLASVPLIS